MIIINDKMIPIYDTLSKGKELNTELATLLCEGFLFENECWFLRALYKKAHVNTNDFIDKTGYECFVNSLHVDDYVSKEHLEAAFAFAREIFKMWKQADNKGHLKGFISQTDHGANIRFHLVREGECWINENELDKFEEAICVLTSSSFN